MRQSVNLFVENIVIYYTHAEKLESSKQSLKIEKKYL